MMFQMNTIDDLVQNMVDAAKRKCPVFVNAGKNRIRMKNWIFCKHAGKTRDIHRIRHNIEVLDYLITKVENTKKGGLVWQALV